MPVVTLKDLRAFLHRDGAELYLIEGIEDSGDAWYIGQAAIHQRDPSWRFGYWGKMSDSAHFYARELSADVTGSEPGVACIFRQFDASPYSETPSEYFAGWVRTPDADRLNGWIDEMNQHVADMLAVKHQRKAQRAACPNCGSSQYEVQRPVRPYLVGDTFHIAFDLQCATCSHGENLDIALDSRESRRLAP